MVKSRYIHLYLPEELVNKVDSIAAEEERSRNFVIKKILDRHINNSKNIENSTMENVTK